MRTQRLASSSDLVSKMKNEQRRHPAHGHEASGHTSVLLHEVIELLSIQESDVVVDGTLGGAGHTVAMVEKLGRKGVCIGIDADAAALERARKALKKAAPRIELREGNFRALGTVLQELGFTEVNKVLLDLGWSGYQLEAGKGFSFKKDESLLMTYGDPTQALFTAQDVVNHWEEGSIADILKGWGEERFARRIAKAIVEARERVPITTSAQLAEVIFQAVPASYRHGRIHPATKTFQALRIAVNDELGALQEALASVRAHLAPAGRVAVITFHSIEDRVVKHTFAAWKAEGFGERITKKPVIPTSEEIAANPRARSAKLRVFEHVT